MIITSYFKINHLCLTRVTPKRHTIAKPVALRFQVKFKLMLVFEEGEKTGRPGGPLEQGHEPATNSTNTWHSVHDSNQQQTQPTRDTVSMIQTSNKLNQHMTHCPRFKPATNSTNMWHSVHDSNQQQTQPTHDTVSMIQTSNKLNQHMIQTSNKLNQHVTQCPWFKPASAVTTTPTLLPEECQTLDILPDTCFQDAHFSIIDS